MNAWKGYSCTKQTVKTSLCACVFCGKIYSTKALRALRKTALFFASLSQRHYYFKKTTLCALCLCGIPNKNYLKYFTISSLIGLTLLSNFVINAPFSSRRNLVKFHLISAS